MSGIKIPVSAELNEQDVQAQIKQIEQALNALGKVAQDAGRVKFTPISNTTVQEAKRLRQEFEAMLRMAPSLQKTLAGAGQGGKPFEQIDWGKVWTDPRQRSGHAHSVLNRLAPGSVELPSAASRPSRTGGGASRPSASPNDAADDRDERDAPRTPRWQKAIRGGLAGAAGGIAGQMGGVAGGIASGALAGGLAGGPWGAAIGAVTGAATGLIDAVGKAREVAITVDTLKRAMGDTSVSFDALKMSTRDLADRYALSDSDATALTDRYARLAGSGKDVNALNQETGVGVGFARSFGLDPAAGVDFFGQLRGMGLTRSADDSRRLALMIGESVAKAGELPKMADVMGGLSAFMQNTAGATLSNANAEAWLSKFAGLEATKYAGINPTTVSNMLAGVNGAISSEGLTTAGRDWMNRTAQNALGVNNPIEAAALLQGGAFATGRSTFGKGTPLGDYYHRNGLGLPAGAGSDQTVFSMLMDSLNARGFDPLLKLDIMRTQFGLQSNAQAAALDMAGSPAVDGLGKRLSRLGLKVGDVNSTGISRLAQLEADGSLSDADKDRLAREVFDKNQEDTVGSEGRANATKTANATERLASEGLPMLNAIQAGVLKIAGLGSMASPERLSRELAIEKDLGAKKDAAKAERDSKISFLHRGAPFLQTPEEAEVDKRYWDAKKAYDDAMDASAAKAKEEDKAKPEWHPVDRSGTPAAPSGPISSAAIRAGKGGESLAQYLQANPELANRLAQEDAALGHPRGTAAAQLWQESRFKGGAVSNQGALGLAQMMPDNVARFSKQAGRQLDPANVEDALLMRRMLMKENQANPNVGHDLDRELMAYFGGASGKAWGPKTRQYPEDVRKHLDALQKADSLPVARDGGDDKLPAVEKAKQAAAREQAEYRHTFSIPDITLRDQRGAELASVTPTIVTNTNGPRASGQARA